MTFDHPGVRHVTPLTPGRVNYGRATTNVARLMFGTAYRAMPWQEHTAALLTEELEPGVPAYSEAYVTVQRRGGKTTLRAPLAIVKCVSTPMARCWLTAQTRQKARDIIVDEAGPRWLATPPALRNRGRLRKSQGSEGIYFRNGSFWRAFAPNADDLHGKDSHLVDVDEGWSFDPLTGMALDQAIAPTLLTTSGQFSILSTQGSDLGSTWFHGKLKRARAALAAGSRQDVAIIDIGLPDHLVAQVREQLEAGADTPQWWAAMETLARHHPAYGHTIRSVRAFGAVARAMETEETAGPDEVLRALGNVPTAVDVSAIPAGKWRDLRWTTGPWPTPASPVYAVAVGFGRVDAAIVAAWRAGDLVLIDVVAHRAGADWVPAELQRITAKWPTTYPVAMDGKGPNEATILELRRQGWTVETTTAAEYAPACADLFAAITDAGPLRHPAHPALDDAVKVAGTAPLGDSWKWSRKGSAGSIAALEAATVARFKLLTLPPPAPRPDFYTPA